MPTQWGGLWEMADLLAAQSSDWWGDTMARCLVELNSRLKKIEDRERLTYTDLANENCDLRREVGSLRSRLQQIAADLSAISITQTKIEANERELEGRRCCSDQ